MPKLLVVFCSFLVNMPRTTKFLKLIHFAASDGENVKKFLP